jgi:flavodoxin I
MNQPIEIGLFYGSTNGATAQVARRIKLLCESSRMAKVELLDVAEYALEEMLDFDLLILGAPTWNNGQLQRDWEEVFEDFDGLDLMGHHVALFGLGDQSGYPDTFLDSLCFLADKLQECGAQLLGLWPIDGYSFRSSWAVRDGQFLGLALDEETQPELTEERLRRWLAQVLAEFAASAGENTK